MGWEDSPQAQQKALHSLERENTLVSLQLIDERRA